MRNRTRKILQRSKKATALSSPMTAARMRLSRVQRNCTGWWTLLRAKWFPLTSRSISAPGRLPRPTYAKTD